MYSRYVTSNSPVHAFTTSSDGNSLIDLGTLGGESSFAYDINNKGQIVGEADTASERHAFVSSSSGLLDLNTFVKLAAGDYLASAVGINDDGQIIATSAFGYAYLLTDTTPVTSVPEPETYAMFLAGLGIMGALTRRRKQKQ